MEGQSAKLALHDQALAQGDVQGMETRRRCARGERSKQTARRQVKESNLTVKMGIESPKLRVAVAHGTKYIIMIKWVLEEDLSSRTWMHRV